MDVEAPSNTFSRDDHIENGHGPKPIASKPSSKDYAAAVKDALPGENAQTDGNRDLSDTPGSGDEHAENGQGPRPVSPKPSSKDYAAAVKDAQPDATHDLPEAPSGGDDSTEQDQGPKPVAPKPSSKDYAGALKDTQPDDGHNLPEEPSSGDDSTEHSQGPKPVSPKPSSKDYAAALKDGQPDGWANDDGSRVEGGRDKAADAGQGDTQSMPDGGRNADQVASSLGRIRFAPWNVPVRRRLQTMAVLVHSLSIATTVSFFFLLCAIPLTWPLMIPYLLHMLFSTAATDGSLRFRSERFRRMRAWRFFADYFPAQLHKTHDLPPTRKYIFGYHPHGIISHGAWAAFATEACGFADKFPGITNSLLTLDSNFRIPLYRDYVLAMGLRSVSKESIGNILTRGGPNGEGMGRAVTIVVGGARESLEARPGTLRLILQERKGFIKLAVRTGADLVPVLAFGENDLYDQINSKTHPSLYALQMFVLRTLKFTLPFLHGRGIFNYDVGLMPYRRPLNVVVGAPIKVTQPPSGSGVDPAEVDRLHGLYVAELQKIWDTYKDEFAKDRKAELQILG